MANGDAVFFKFRVHSNACHASLEAAEHIDFVDPEYLVHASHVDYNDHS